MADEPIARLSVDVVANLKINKSQTAKAVKEIKDTVEEVNSKSGHFGFSSMLKDVTGVAQVAGKAISMVGKALGSLGKWGFNKAKTAIKETVKHLNGFFSAIKRIAVYRAIRWALKEIVQGFQEGIQNAYYWSQITGNQFARSMDMMSTAALYLKNSLGAMTMPLVNVLAPILDRLTDQFVTLINAVNQFIATITGASSWVRALKYPAEYLESAAGSAKELKNQLLGFDELNILNAPSGGGSASALDYSNMFQQMELDPKNFDLAKAIKEAIKKNDWKSVGELISSKFNEMINNIPAIDWSTAIGEKVNHALTLVHTLLSEIDFQQVGVKIGQFMSNLQLNWSYIAGSWVRWKTNILDILLGLVQGVNWKNVGKAIGDAISGLFNEFADWLNSVNWYQKGQEFTNAIIDLIANVNWGAVASALWQALKGALNAALGLLTGTMSNIDFSTYASMIQFGQAPMGAGSYSSASGVNGAVAGAMAGVPRYASGGFPAQGTMFLAGENGAEFVGNIGGRTGVYNADQMAQSLSTANEQIVETLTAVGNAIVGAINRKDTSINTNDVRRALVGMQMRYGV